MEGREKEGRKNERIKKTNCSDKRRQLRQMSVHRDRGADKPKTMRRPNWNKNDEKREITERRMEKQAADCKAPWNVN